MNKNRLNWDESLNNTMGARKRMRRYRITGMITAMVGAFVLAFPGCTNPFLGLEDYQRDVLSGLLAAALLGQSLQGTGGDGATQPIDGRDGVDGLNCWDLNGNATPDAAEDTNGDGGFDALDCQGADGVGGDGDNVGQDGAAGTNGVRCWDLNGNGMADDNEDRNNDGFVTVLDCAGSDGADGSDGGGRGPRGAPGADGQDGPELFSIFIDDFFGSRGPFNALLPVVLVRVDEPVLGVFESATSAGDFGDGVAYRVAIPDSYAPGNDVTMRLYFYRFRQPEGECFIFTVDGRRARNGGGVEPYGDTRWVRIDPPSHNVAGNGIIDDILLAVDLPINTAAGLGGPTDLAGGDLLAFELSTHQPDGALYELLGVEFTEMRPGRATLGGATVFSSEDETCCLDAPPEPVGPLAYISDTGSDNVWIVDMGNETVVDVIDVGDDPRGIDISPDNSRVYVANRFGGSVSVIDTSNHTVVQTIDLEGNELVTAIEPYDVVVSPDGEWLYIAMKNGGDENGDGTVVTVGLPAGVVVAEVVLDSSASLEGIAVTPDGRKVYAAGRGSMYVVDVSTPSLPVFLGTSGSAGRELVVSPDGRWVYADNNAVRTSDDTALVTGDSSGERGVAISPGGTVLFSTDEGSAVEVVEITMVEGLPVTTFVANIDDPDNRQFEAYGIDLTDAGDRGLVSFRSSRTVRIFDTATLRFVGRVIPMEFAGCSGAIFSSEPKQLVIAHSSVDGPD